MVDIPNYNIHGVYIYIYMYTINVGGTTLKGFHGTVRWKCDCEECWFHEIKMEV